VVKIVLADDHNVVRQGLRALLETESGLTLVGEASDGLEVVPLVEKTQPDVLIVDVRMPGLNGLDVTRQVTQKIPATRVIVLSMYADEAYVVQALKNGASAYVLKESRAADLLEAIREVTAGRRYLSPPLSARSIDDYLARTEADLDPYETLSPREREVFQLAAEGHSNPDIATRLEISARTVETHRANAMKKLNLKGQTDIVRFAIRKGLVSPGE
jgi:two-component system, NarL family, response regulator NreC